MEQLELDFGEEHRLQAIAQNGNTGEHYGYVHTQGPDMVNRPPHYTQGGIECIDALQAALTPEEFKGYCKAAAIKYLWRLDHKGSAKENAEKALWYLQRLVKVL
jgi:hypothetical protein